MSVCVRVFVCVRVCVWTASSENSVLNRRYLKEKLLYNKNWIFWGKKCIVLYESSRVQYSWNHIEWLFLYLC